MEPTDWSAYALTDNRQENCAMIQTDHTNTGGAATTVVHLAPADLARRWHVTSGHLANLRSGGTGPAFLKLGSRVVYRVSDIEAYEAAARVEAVA